MAVRRWGELLLSAGALHGWLFLASRSYPFWAALSACGLGLVLGLWRPRVALGLLLAAAVVTPFFCSLAGQPGFAPSEGGLLALWTAVSWRRRGDEVRPLDGPDLWALSLALFAAAGAVVFALRLDFPSAALGAELLRHPLGELLSLRPESAFYGFRALLLPLAGLAAYRAARLTDAPGTEPVRAVLWGLWSGGGLAALSYFVFYLPRLDNPALHWLSYRSALTFHDPNSASSFGLLALGAGLALSAGRMRRLPLFLLPALLILVHGGSRTANLLALCGLGALLLFGAKARGTAATEDPGRPLLTRGAAVAGLLLVASLVVLSSFHNHHYGDVFSPSRLAETGVGGRLAYWRAAASMIRDHPLAGVGPAGFPKTLPRYLEKSRPELYDARENAHCYPLQVAAEYGLPGLLLALGFLWAVVAPRLRQWRRLSHETAGLLTGALLYLAHCLQSHPLLLFEQQILFGAALAALAGSPRPPVEEAPSRRRRLLPLLALPLPLAGLFHSVPYADQARSYGLYPADLAGQRFDYGWSGPEAWWLLTGGGGFTFKASAPRPDLEAKRPELTVEVDGRPLLAHRFAALQPVQFTVPPAPGAPGRLVHIRVAPPIVPSEATGSRDRRSLGTRVGLPRDGSRIPEDNTQPLQIELFAPTAIRESVRTCACEILTAPSRLEPDEELVVAVRFRNAGEGKWPGESLLDTPRQLNASYRWVDASGKPVPLEGARTPFAADLAPGADWTVRLAVRAPGRPGVYRLEPDLIQENVGWFGCRAASPAPWVEVAP